jgi:DNA-binding ferritin-like protein
MKVITPLLKIQNQLRIFHWQTTSYAQHKAFGKAYESLDGHIDEFVEVYMGKYGRTRAKMTYNIELENLADNYLAYINDSIAYLHEMSNELDALKDSDLLNIRDTMLGELNRLKYLLTLQ